MGGLPNELIPDPHLPQTEGSQIDIMWGRRVAWSPLWWWPCPISSVSSSSINNSTIAVLCWRLDPFPVPVSQAAVAEPASLHCDTVIHKTYDQNSSYYYISLEISICQAVRSRLWFATDTLRFLLNMVGDANVVTIDQSDLLLTFNYVIVIIIITMTVIAFVHYVHMILVGHGNNAHSTR